MAARQLTYFAAKAKDSGRRCDLEAGMAKESIASRLLVDTRAPSIFEGTNETQAHVIARRLLETAPGSP